jgi:hypothetical protein
MKRLPEKPRRRWNSIKFDLKEIGHKSVDRFDLVQIKDQYLWGREALANTVTSFWEIYRPLMDY